MKIRNVLKGVPYVIIGLFISMCFSVYFIKMKSLKTLLIRRANSTRKIQFATTLNCSLCIEERSTLLNTYIDETIDIDVVFKSLAKDTRESGIYKMFMPQNFFNVTCEDPVIRFSSTVMPPVNTA